MVRGMIVGLAVIVGIGSYEAAIHGGWEGLVQPVGALAMIGWAVWMLRRDSPNPVPILMTGVMFACLFLVGSAWLGDAAVVTSSSPLVIIAAAGMVVAATGGRRSLPLAGVALVAVAMSVAAVQLRLDKPISYVATDAATAFVMLGLTYALVRTLRTSMDAAASAHRGVLDTAPVAIYELVVSDSHPGREAILRLSRVNARAENLLGSSAGVSLRRPDDGPWTAWLFESLLPSLGRGRLSGTEVIEIPSPDRSFLVSWHALDDELRRVIVTAVDITIQREAERQLKEQVRFKDRFVATVSHELRTPLTAVLGLLELLAGNDVHSGEHDEFLALALDQTRDMNDIIQDLLVAARASGGGLVVNPELLDVAAVSSEVTEAFPADFVYDIEGSVWAMGDPVRVKQVLRNLLTNAIRYGGSRRRVAVTSATHSVAIEVRDNGLPIDDRLQQHMFEPYTDSSGQRRPTESVGIGLTVARTLAQLMDGDLTYSHDGHESIFTLILPAPRTASPSPDTPKQRTPPPERQSRR